MQGERDLSTVSRLIMSELTPLVNAQYVVFYVASRNDQRAEEPVVEKTACVVEVVALLKETNTRRETVSCMVKHTEVEVEGERRVIDRTGTMDRR